MNTSDQGLQLICEREGKRNEAYLDTRGIVTIGVGHVSPAVKMGDVWTDQQVMDALRADLRWCEAAINDGDPILEQYEFDALVSFTFNVGPHAYANSSLKRLVEGADVVRAAAEFDRWHIPAEITSRRNAEKAQFMGEQFVARIEKEMANG